ncbi:MAG: cyclic nucleotide-binding domain-containing protein [Pseudomonadota bacterium]
MDEQTFAQAALLVHFASALYVVAFLVKDQLWLRTLVLVATLAYIIYYYAVPAEPLWDAIGWSVVLGLANLFILVQLVLQRTTLTLSEEEKALYANFSTLQPGEFRKLVKIATWRTVDTPLPLTHDGQTNAHLHFVLTGTCAITKGERSFSVDAPAFIGEVSFFLNEPASATVHAQPGSRVISWDRARLDLLLKRNIGLRIALHSIMNTDMARKVARS